MKRFFAKRSIGATVMGLVAAMLLLFLLVASSSLTTLFNSLNDAAAINVAGSLRMQSYRLAYALEHNDPKLQLKIEQFERSLASESLVHVKEQNEQLRNHYRLVQERWKQLRPLVEQKNLKRFNTEVISYVDLIDQFVALTQYNSERKVQNLTWLQVFAFALISGLSIYSLWYIRRHIVNPIYRLVEVAKQVQGGNFDVQPETGQASIELETLSNAIASMSSELRDYYQNLEQQVREKTSELQRANQDLNFLYQLEQLLFNSQLNPEHLQQAVNLLRDSLGIPFVKLELNKLQLELESGEEQSEVLQRLPLQLDQDVYGELAVSQLEQDRQAIITSFARTLTKVVRFEQSLLQKQKLLLMEERATIARELHDSLAQSLSYLKIQTTLLRRSIEQNDAEKVDEFVTEIQRVISDAYVQLRELLSTFRLTIKNALLTESLQVVINELSTQHSHHITLLNKVSHDAVPADQQIHIIHIVREAIINAIKHAQCDSIEVNCIGNDEQIEITIEDNGRNGEKLKSVADHYGLQIMKERANRLNGRIDFGLSPSGGVSINLVVPRS